MFRGESRGAPHHRQRVRALDVLRGAAVVSMIIYHACYDAVVLFDANTIWFTNTIVRSVWSASISWTFLIVSGWMTVFSRSNARRALLYGACALGVSAATWVAEVDTPISYGILFCMAASTLMYSLSRPIFELVSPWLGLFLCCALFMLTWAVPTRTYPVEHLAWLGLRSSAFSSGDYYPLLPYSFLYLAGAFLGRVMRPTHPRGYPAWMLRDRCKVLSAIGRASLPIYLVHQPVLLLFFHLWLR
ncbi:protein of unknown function DUF1624 [Coriobacterium glomerans PW2]|uniref:Heparan-alpha-glucosaminide N-acetyltransferase catalytic domain-containing protein n=1 Tax=Coriobacterium glomerans (strain ATCC 49209 / DSM 20642 / JCM 10262 / PW2) TaxID=700015 RepID=F2N7X2_CORGP|nr:heparan-alpha-glucosaminide N-acetyltransferase [Coriobacterium glomerans]AEB07081.1 protein of unknown function DUF1624 [Coriobacterium glomerans PW2]